MREHYIGGREHAAIKHFFLKQYLEALCLKTLQFQKDGAAFSYIDGFTGPWGAKDDKFQDTSFGVALDVLKRVRRRLGNVDLKCVFCETRRKAFVELERFVSANSQGIAVKCVYGRFEDHISEINSFIGARGFLFAFIDPKGFNVDSNAIAALLRDRWSEVLFNFMTEFVGRFPDFKKVEQSYAALLSDGDWRARFDETPDNLSNEDRLLYLFRGVLKDKWKFSHVLELPIKKANRDRVFYTLVYGTRSPHGVLTFRDAQARAEKEGFAVALESEWGGQANLFSSDETADQIAAAVGVGSQRNLVQLPNAITGALKRGETTFVKLAADVLELIPARESDVKAAVSALHKAGAINARHPDGKRSITKKSLLWLSAT